MKNITYVSTYISIHTPVRLPMTPVLFYFITYVFGIRVFSAIEIPKPPCTYINTYIHAYTCCTRAQFIYPMGFDTFTNSCGREWAT